LKQYDLQINSNNISLFSRDPTLKQIPVKNICINYDQKIEKNEVICFLQNFNHSIEKIEIKNLKAKNFKECFDIFHGMVKLTSIYLENCSLESLNSEILPPIDTLTTLSFNKSNDNVFKIFKQQSSLKNLIVQNNDWTWSGFPHDIFNEIARNAENLDMIKLIGSGTGSYFDCDEFPFKIRKLETSMITFHWYVGIKTKRVGFLQSQKGHLKELTIHQLPLDFDGGKVLKHIIEEMDLETFYLGKTPLILNGKKQDVKEFEATEIQITSAFEMMTHFPSKFINILLLYVSWPTSHFQIIRN